MEKRKYEASTIQDNQMALGDIQVQASEYHCEDNTHPERRKRVKTSRRRSK